MSEARFEDETDLCRWPAVKQAAAIRSGEITASQLLEAQLARIAQTNEAVNAIVTLDVDGAREEAERADSRTRSGEALGVLHGLPTAFKDLEDTAGMRTTYGSLHYQDHVPTRNTTLVERTKAAGAVTIGKTNTPEYGTGGHTHNLLFGTTRNPYNLAKSVGGSSGGAGAALATGMVSIADGSDLGGSLRNPASFTNTVGFRPGTGRVPSWPAEDAWFDMSVNGPMGRTVADVAMLLSVQAGYDRRSPIALDGDGSEFLKPLEAELEGLRLGWSENLLDLDIDPRVTEVLNSAGRSTLSQLPVSITDMEPDLRAADEVFRTLRAWSFDGGLSAYAAEHEGEVSPLLAQNVQMGRGLSARQLFEASKARTQVFERMQELFTKIDVLVAPVTSVPPFPADQLWVTEINGKEQKDYLEWMRSTWRITVTGFPAISVPCGFTADGLPVGIQFVVRPREEMLALQIAHAFESLNPAWRLAPPVVHTAA